MRCGAWLFGVLLTAASLASAQAPGSADPDDRSEKGLTLDDALTATLRDNPNIQLAARDVEAQRGALVAAGEPFDVKTQTSFSTNRINSLTPDPNGAPFFLPTNQTQYSVGVQRQLRNGLVFSPEMSVLKTALPGLPVLPTGQSTAKLSVLVPLLKDRGGIVTSAPERAADRAYEAAVLQSQHVAAQAIVGAAIAYWDYLAAIRRLAVVAESETRAERLAGDTRRLVEAGERTLADLTQVRGNLAAKRVNRIAAEQAVVDARVHLGLQMGIGTTETAGLPPPTTEFPVADDLPAGAIVTPAIVDEALDRRPDLLATQKQVESANLILTAARDNLKPRVDLIGGFGYEGLQLGRGLSSLLSPLYRNVPGAEASVQVRYQWAAANVGARGRVMQSASGYSQQRIAQTELRRQISTGVFQASEAIARAAAGMKAAQEAVTLYQAMVRSEQRKFQLGVSTLFDTIQATDGLTNVMLSEIAAEREYAASVAMLRFQTGSLLAAGRDGTTVDVDRLLSPR
jgi:outer membrane protein